MKFQGPTMNSNKYIIPILVIIALGLGVAIYRKNNPSLGQSTVNPSPNPSAVVSPLDEKLTADQKALFYSPSKEATKEELSAFSALVAKNAKEGDKIIIKDCTANPIVLKVKLGSTFTVQNIGKTDIHFGFENERTLVKAGTSAEIKAQFSHGQGIYGYGCDDPALSRSIGLLLITQ